MEEEKGAAAHQESIGGAMVRGAREVECYIPTKQPFSSKGSSFLSPSTPFFVPFPLSRSYQTPPKNNR